MTGWAIFMLGLACVVLGAYTQIGYWVCIPVWVAYCVMIQRNIKHSRERKVVLRRLMEG